jgi:hypothetical protein
MESRCRLQKVIGKRVVEWVDADKMRTSAY